MSIEIKSTYYIYSSISAVENLLVKLPGVMKITKSDGTSALHIATINDHQTVASILITKVCFLNFHSFCLKPIIMTSFLQRINNRRSWHGITTPFFNFLFTYLISINISFFLYYFISFSLF